MISVSRMARDAQRTGLAGDSRELVQPVGATDRPSAREEDRTTTGRTCRRATAGARIGPKSGHF
jgi:hypothetical protein